MNTFDAIRNRRSVKHYDTAHRMTRDQIDTLIGHAILAPSSFNIQHWRFLVAEDPDVRAQIREAAWGQAQVTDASALIVLCADLKAWEKEPARYWKDAPVEAREALLPMIGQFYADNEPLERDEALRSIGIAAGTLMIAARAMGYDTCPMIGFDPQKVAEIIRLPDDHMIGMMISVGKGTQPAWPRGGQLPMDEVRLRDAF